MDHYVSVLVPVATGGWRALLPDIPEYQAEERSLDLAILRATEFLAQTTRLGSAIPPPRPLALIKLDTDWASARGIDWSQSIITMIQVHGTTHQMAASLSQIGGGAMCDTSRPVLAQA